MSTREARDNTFNEMQTSMQLIMFWRCFSRLCMINSCPQSSTSIFILSIGSTRIVFNWPASAKLLLLRVESVNVTVILRKDP